MTKISTASPSTTKSTVNSTTTQTTNIQNSSAGNPMGTCNMAHDFFGSQAFGNSIYTAGNISAGQTANPQQTTSEPEIFVLNENTQNLASQLLNEHFIMEQEKALAKAGKIRKAGTAESGENKGATGAESPKQNSTQTMPTAQDYFLATQIANQFANMNTLSSPYTSYSERDYFAQSTFDPRGEYKNGFNFSA